MTGLDLFGDISIIGHNGARGFDARYVLQMPYTIDTQERVKNCVPGSQKKDRGVWHVPVTTWHENFLRGLAVPWTEEARRAAKEQRKVEEWRLRMSSQDEPDERLSLPGFGVDDFNFQNGGIQYGLDAQKVWISDDMGLGKTIQGLGIIYGAQLFPALIVVPSSLKFNWEKEINRAMPGRNVCIANKKTPYLRLQLADVIVTNYEQMLGFETFETEYEEACIDPSTCEVIINVIKKRGRTCWKEHDNGQKSVILSPLAQALRELPIKILMLDEGHKIKEDDTAQTAAILELRKNIAWRVSLTGTPMVNKPRDLYTTLRLFDLQHHFGGYHWYHTYFCGLKETDRGPQANEAHNGLELNDMLRRLCYVRRKKSQVFAQLPPKTRTAIPVEIDNRAEYEKAQNDLLEWVRERVLEDEKFLGSIAYLASNPGAYQQAIRDHQDYKKQAAERGKAMVMIQALKDVAVRGKLKQLKEWIDNFLEQGEKLVVFAHHIKHQEWLMKLYPKAARIISGDSVSERQRNVDRFQEDPFESCPMIICAQGGSVTSSPGGVGWTLAEGTNVLFFELGWNPALHDQCEDRCYRIDPIATKKMGYPVINPVSAWYILAENTIEIDIAGIIETKREVSAQVVDGDESVQEARILDAIWEKLAEKITTGAKKAA